MGAKLFYTLFGWRLQPIQERHSFPLALIGCISKSGDGERAWILATTISAKTVSTVLLRYIWHLNCQKKEDIRLFIDGLNHLWAFVTPNVINNFYNCNHHYMPIGSNCCVNFIHVNTVKL